MYVADAGCKLRFQLGYQSNTHTWPLHMVFHLGQFRLFYKMENSKQNKMGVHGIFMTSPHTASLLSRSISQSKSQSQLSFKWWKIRLILLMGGAAKSHLKGTWTLGFTGDHYDDLPQAVPDTHLYAP